MEGIDRHARQLGPAQSAILAAEIAALLGMHVLEIRRAVDLQHAAPDADGLDAIGDIAAHQALDMLVRVVPIPDIAIGALPFLAAHERMFDRDGLKIVFVEIWVHPYTLL